jgi:hypothetical protein
MLYTDNLCLLSIPCYFVDGGQYHRTVENEARHRSLINGDKKQNSYDTSEVIIEQIKLKKSVGLISGTSLIVGTIIGNLFVCIFVFNLTCWIQQEGIRTNTHIHTKKTNNTVAIRNKNESKLHCYWWSYSHVWLLLVVL